MIPEKRQAVVAYLLGELTPGEGERFEAELLRDPEMQAELDQLRPVVTRLEQHPAEAWDPVEPPPLDVAAIVGADSAATKNATATAPAEAPAAVEAVPAEASPPVETVRPRRSLAERLGFGWPSIAAAGLSALLILAVGIGVGTQLGGDEATPAGEPVVASSLETIGNEVPDGASGEVFVAGSDDSDGDRLTLDVSGLDQSGEREFYELWLLGEDDELVSLGSFRVPADGSSQIEVPLPVDPGQYTYFDVSIEPENGSPDHSGRSVLRGLTSA